MPTIDKRGFCCQGPRTVSQRGMVLVVSLIFLLLLTLVGISSMQNATLQEKMSGSVQLRNQSFQFAEASLRVAELVVHQPAYTISACASVIKCAPPTEATTVDAAGLNVTSGVTWVATSGGLYGVQKIGTTKDPVNSSYGLDESLSWTLYRITGVGLVGSQGGSRTVVESIYARLD